MIFFASSEGVEFNCSLMNFNWKYGGTVYECFVSKEGVTLLNVPMTLQSVTGVHIKGQFNSDVTALRVFQEPVLKKLPKKVERFFPHLISYRWMFGALTSVSAEDFRPFPKLKVLSLGNNNIVTLDGDLFKYSPSLAHIHLWNNLITNVGKDLLASTDVLETVNFKNNTCINYEASTPRQILNLKRGLILNCPPLDTDTETYPLNETTTKTATILWPVLVNSTTILTSSSFKRMLGILILFITNKMF